MEQIEKVYKNIKKYLYRHMGIENYNDLELSYQKLNGLSNDIYLVKIQNKTTNELIQEIIYRKFGEISDLVDRELEMRIVDNLSNKGVGPKILETDNKTYRIEEFISNAAPMEKSVLKEEEIIERVMHILISYSLISGVYHYNIHSESFTEDYKIKIDPAITSNPYMSHERINQNIFDMCVKSMYEKATKNFETFSDKCRKNYNKFLKKEIFTKFEKLSHFMKNYHDLFMEVFPKNGLFVLNHNDVHRLNILLAHDKQKAYLLDHEYAAINLIGVDIVNYLIESNFDYTIKLFLSNNLILKN